MDVSKALESCAIDAGTLFASPQLPVVVAALFAVAVVRRYWDQLEGATYALVMFIRCFLGNGLL